MEAKQPPKPGSGEAHGIGAPTEAEQISPPRSVPPVMPSLPPRPPPAVAAPRVDLSAEHPWLAAPTLALLRRSVRDEHLVTLHLWDVDPTWTTNQIVGHVHAALEKKADRRMFEAQLVKCQDKAALVELVHATLSALPPEVAERHARMRSRAR
jgi:hypothetical protein